MKIRGNKLEKAMKNAGVTAQQLADQLAQPGLDAKDALRSLNNWMADRDHPRCKAKMVRQIAEALRTSPKELVAFTSEVRHHRGSPRKARLVTDMIRGKNVDQALNLLTFTTKRAAVNVKKCLNAAIADAEQSECDITRLFVAESRVDNAAVIKRFQPKDRGRAHPILKPLSHITISVEERAAKA
ncbi:MAG: 50S ribosomal protein L22 [Phycisphaerales bacterium]